MGGRGQVATGYCTRTLTGHTEWVRRVALSDDGEMLASCGNDHSIKVGSESLMSNCRMGIENSAVDKCSFRRGLCFVIESSVDT